MTKKGFLIAAAVLLLAGVLALVFRFAGGDPGGKVQVKVDGRVVGTYSLAEDRTVPFDTKYGHNRLTVEGGEAFMTESDCPDHYCEAQGHIDRTGETIVCLPHKPVPEVVAGECAAADAVAQ